MNNKTIFNLKLYKDAIKQLRLFSIISFALMTIISIMIPIAMYIDAKDSSNMIDSTTGTIIKQGINVLEATGFLIVFPVIIAPILTLMIFKFLTNRNSSDVYHSMPHTRLCIIVSYLAALFTIILAMITISTTITAISYSLLSKYVLFSFSQLIAFSINIFIVSILVISATAFACSITGTLFANISFTGLILFLPRFFIYAFVSVVSNALPNAVGNVLPILESKFNHLFNIVTWFLGSSSNGILLKLSFSTIYTSILCIIFITFAIICFRNRKSETAGNSTNSQWLQGFSTISLGMAISLIPLSMIFDFMIHKDAGTSYYYHYVANKIQVADVFSIIVLYIFAILAMFIYELISSKKLLQALKSLIYVPVVFVLNIVFLLLVTFSFNNMLNYTPTVDDLSYVRLFTDDSTIYYYNSEQDYFESKLTKIEITDENIISLICDANKDFVTSYIDFLDGGTFNYNIFGSYFISPYELEYYENEESNYGYTSEPPIVHFSVSFKDGIFEHQREIFMSTAKYKELLKILTKQEEYVSIYTDLPKIDSTTSCILQGYSTVLKNEDASIIYNALIEDLKTVSIDEYMKTFTTNPYIGYLLFTSLIDSDYHTGTIRITPTTPKAYAAMLMTISEEKEISLTDIDKFIDELKNNVKIPINDYYDISIMVYDNETGECVDEFEVSKYDNQTSGTLTWDNKYLNNLVEIKNTDNLDKYYTVAINHARSINSSYEYNYTVKSGIFFFEK